MHFGFAELLFETNSDIIYKHAEFRWMHLCNRPGKNFCNTVRLETYVIGKRDCGTWRALFLLKSAASKHTGENKQNGLLSWAKCSPIRSAIAEMLGLNLSPNEICFQAFYCCDRKSPSGMCAKFHTVAASNNRVHAPRSLSAYASHQVQSFTC